MNLLLTCAGRETIHRIYVAECYVCYWMYLPDYRQILALAPCVNLGIACPVASTLGDPASRGEGDGWMSFDVLVIGLGYVGLPLAHEAAFSGLKVAGFDINQALVRALNSGHSHVGDVPDAAVAEMLAKGFRATAEEREVGTPETVVI